MAKSSSSKNTGVSFRTKDQISTGLFGPGPATIKGSEFMEASKEYSASRPIIWLITYSRPGEEDYESIYSIGKGWDVSKDGALVPKNGQTGLPSSSYGAMLAASLEEAGVPEDILSQIGDDPHVIEDTDVELIAKTLPRADIKDDDRGGRGRDRGREEKKQFDKTILLVDKLLSDVGEGGKLEGGKAGKGEKTSSTRSSRSSHEKDDDKEEKPDRSSRGRSSDKDDEKPARRGGRDDDKDKGGKNDADDDIDDAAKEALLEALEEKGGKIKVADLESAVSRKLKGNKKKDDILDRVIEDEFLELENGWSYKNGAVALD